MDQSQKLFIFTSDYNMESQSLASALKKEQEYITDDIGAITFDVDSDSEPEIYQDAKMTEPVYDDFRQEFLQTPDIQMDVPEQVKTTFNDKQHKKNAKLIKDFAEKDALLPLPSPINKKFPYKRQQPKTDDLDAIIESKFEKPNNRKDDLTEIKPAPYCVKQQKAQELKKRPIPQFKPEDLEPIPLQLTTTDQIHKRRYNAPDHIDVKFFSRNDHHFFSANTMIGHFIVPYLHGCLRSTETYHSMLVKASDLLKQTKPYSSIRNFFNIKISEPSFTFETSHSQYTVSDNLIPRRYNKYIPDPRLTSEGTFTIIMIATIELIPVYSILDVRTMSNTPDENQRPQQVPITNRLGPPVQRSFQSYKVYRIQPTATATATAMATSTPIPEASCSAPKTARTTKTTTKNQDGKSKPRLPLAPKQLHF